MTSTARHSTYLRSAAHGRARAALAVGALAATSGLGCVALPFGTPPMTVTAAPGLALGQSLPAAAGSDADGTKGVIAGRVALRPLSMIEGEQDRTFGASLGYLTEVPPDESMLGYTRHGAFVGLTHYPWTSDRSDGGWYTRLGINAMPELLVTEDEGKMGAGMTFSFDVETFSYADGSFSGADSDGAVLGGALGEGGIGFSLGAGVRGIDRLRYWMLTAGLTLRLPAVAGILIVPAWELVD